MQGFEQHILYNAAKSHSRQLAEGEDYNLLNPVIALTLTDFVMFKGDQDTSHFILLEKARFIQYRGDIELIFIGLPKFNKAQAALMTLRDKWLYCIKNAGRLTSIPKGLNQELPIRAAFANTAALTEAELEALAIARNLLRMLDDKVIAAVTGLTPCHLSNL
jgi:predicted transposase/invertase (TIGR01784 family)